MNEIISKKTNTLTRAAILLAVALVFQFVKFGQLITGSGINAALIMAAHYCGLTWAAGIGAITPFMAFILGVQPPAIVPAIPFIMAANALYAAVYAMLKNKNVILAVAFAAVLKFGFLYTIVNYIIDVKPPIQVALSFPQLATALIGGAAAIIIINIMKRQMLKNKLS